MRRTLRQHGRQTHGRPPGITAAIADRLERFETDEFENPVRGDRNRRLGNRELLLAEPLQHRSHIQPDPPRFRKPLRRFPPGLLPQLNGGQRLRLAFQSSFQTAHGVRPQQEDEIVPFGPPRPFERLIGALDRLQRPVPKFLLGDLRIPVGRPGQQLRNVPRRITGVADHQRHGRKVSVFLPGKCHANRSAVVIEMIEPAQRIPGHVGVAEGFEHLGAIAVGRRERLHQLPRNAPPQILQRGSQPGLMHGRVFRSLLVRLGVAVAAIAGPDENRVAGKQPFESRRLRGADRRQSQQPRGRESQASGTQALGGHPRHGSSS